MNIPSIESLLAELDKVRRERDSYKKAWNSAEDQITELKETRNRLSGEVDEIHAARSFLRDQNRLLAENHALKSALREAKEALIPYIKFVDGTQVKNHAAQVYERINKVLGEK